MFIRFGWPGSTRTSVAAVAAAALVLSPVAVACGGDDRPPEPTCPAGQEAEWDDGVGEWECEDDDLDISVSGGKSKHRRR